ncbi:polysaccharide lyase family 8 super-sandwich domain-containing protein [Chitinophaga barathri]|uniref:T9SS C-terminal target domain-containing protein n=1 Tax=Chitinophaga barathri TaxID=1647451 RepID=A0A3N4MED3_9BACT|nr:polysaccharide lyase family 8 super-sandwich domain-containing protein [Chitinophaga barathri]RPD42151.1 T9SS C-terminal target domain-containing protein [Chitinophaga barathri]
MKTILLIAVVALTVCGQVKSQQRSVSFDSEIPVNWQTSSATPLSLSAEHVKGGGNALKWQAQNGDYISATGLAIPSSEVRNATTGQAQIFFYLPEATEDTLLFQFMDGSGVVQRQGKMLLNFKGWRDFHRSYYYDYNFGDTLTTFGLEEMRITYIPKNPANTCTLHIDEAVIIGDNNVRLPGPQVLPDYAHFRKHVTNAPYLNVLPNWVAGPDLPVVSATGPELADLAVLRTRFARGIGTVAPTLTTVKNYVTACQISTNPDGTLNGRGLKNIYRIDSMVIWSTYISVLAKASKASDADAIAKLELFTKYLLDEGMAEGGRIIFQTNSYPNARTFPVGFLEALPYYTPAVRAQVLDMLKWNNEYSVIYGATFTEGYSVDFLNLRIIFLFELALANPDDDVAVRDVKMVKRYLERNTVPGIGGRDGMKPDGVGYHHGSQHTSYMAAWGRWIDMAEKLKGTVYRVDLASYENLSKGITYLLAGSSKGVLYAHAESGRNPFPAALPIDLGRFQKFVLIGGDIKGEPADQEMGAFYNSVTGTSTFDVSPKSADGFYQYNYGALGIQRKNNWTAVMRGFTSKIFGAEIYSLENRYGRYQSYGTLEVLYGGTSAATGYILAGKGWDWNVMPGTTTVHFPNYDSLQPKKTTAMEFQNNNFAGSLSLGQEGIFGLNLDEKANGNYGPSRLKAKKSVFAFDSIMICLGSSINAINNMGNVATNLFQAIDSTTNPAIYVNSTTPLSTQPYTQDFDTQPAGIWLLNAQTTGYYIPQGNGIVTVVRGQQSTPKENVANHNLPNSFATAYASKAWINHDLNPVNKKYHFVVAPGITPADMQALATQLAGGTLYSILKQTDTMHIVRYNPLALTGYVFFKATTAVNTGHVKSVSAVCVAGIRENGDTITVTVNSPDMNITTETAFNYYWKSNPRTVTLVLNGNWDVVENLSGASITHSATTATASFTLQHGFSQTIKLKVPDGARRAQAVADSTGIIAKQQEDGKEKRFTVFPNPASKNMDVEFTAVKAGMAHIRIFNMQGALMQSKQISFKQGLNRSPVDVSGLKAGSYVIVLTGTDIQERGIFIKQ